MVEWYVPTVNAETIVLIFGLSVIFAAVGILNWVTYRSGVDVMRVADMWREAFERERAENERLRARLAEKGGSDD